MTLGLGLEVRTVGDMGALPDTLPVLLLPDVPLTFETLQIIFPYTLAVAVVGLLESLMTQNLVDELTETRTSRDQECIGQGLANTATGFIGGMAGCAMIGQSMINVKSGGRGRLSCAFAGVMLLGVLLSGIFFDAKIAQLFRVTVETEGDTRIYRVEGQLFYGSVEDFTAAFDSADLPARLVIDVTDAHIWDISSVQARDLVVLKLRHGGAQVDLLGMNSASETLMDKLSLQDKSGAMDKIAAH